MSGVERPASRRRRHLDHGTRVDRPRRSWRPAWSPASSCWCWARAASTGSRGPPASRAWLPCAATSGSPAARGSWRSAAGPACLCCSRVSSSTRATSPPWSRWPTTAAAPGLLRSGLGVLPPGDIRSCLVALADDESLMSRLFQYRFPQDGGLQGHSFGNLFVAALADVTGDFERAVQESTAVLKVRGRVLPATLAERHAARRAAGRGAGGRRVVDHRERAPAAARLARTRPAAGHAGGARGDRRRRSRRARPGQRVHEHRAEPADPRGARGAQADAGPGRVRVQRHDPARRDRRSHARPTTWGRSAATAPPA